MLAVGNIVVVMFVVLVVVVVVAVVVVVVLVVVVVVVALEEIVSFIRGILIAMIFVHTNEGTKHLTTRLLPQILSSIL